MRLIRKLEDAIRLRRLLIAAFDGLAVLAAFLLAFLLRFEFNITSPHFENMIRTAPYMLASYVLSGLAFSLYDGIYYYSSYSDILRIGKGISAAAFISAATIMFAQQGVFPRSILILHPILAFLSICAVRFGIRLVKTKMKVIKGTPFIDLKNVLLVGAGELGESLFRQISKTPESGLNVVGFIDDDSQKWGLNIHGIPILGGRSALVDMIRKYDVDEIIISISSTRGDLARDILQKIQKIHPRPELKIAPSLTEMLSRRTSAVNVRRILPSDLLNRKEIRLDERRIAKTLERKTILVSGAGGTIGSGLCREALRYFPEKIILLENHGTSLFYRDTELRELSRGTAIVSVLGDTKDRGLINRVFEKHKPHIVLHAAAHKHVHQLEFNVAEGIANNVMGTFQLAQAADTYGAESFLLVSTDKAVNPSSVMGATKHLAEIITRDFDKKSKTTFCAVRFGNVLGSSGSVLKIFQDQIEKGGPLTVTDKRATRYFMTVEESVGLILQAISMAKGGEIFILRMGTPVNIYQMAKNLLTLANLTPDEDIEIEITGLKHGEKLDEELSEDPNGLHPSEHEDVFTLKEHPEPPKDLEKRVLDLEIACRGTDEIGILNRLLDLVPTFHPASHHQFSRGA